MKNYELNDELEYFSWWNAKKNVIALNGRENSLKDFSFFKKILVIFIVGCVLLTTKKNTDFGK